MGPGGTTADLRLGRRDFLTGAAGAALALTAGGLPAWAASTRPRRAAGPGPHDKDLERVEHVVILMQENISFDHYFGTLAGVRGFGDPDALRLPDGHSVFEQPYPLTPDGRLRPWRFDDTVANPCSVLIDNSWASRHHALDGGRMDRFVTATANVPNWFTMAYYARAQVPWHMALADAFTVCDAYHCSVLGPTNPNRLMMWTGTIDPHGRNGGPDYDNQAYTAKTPYTWMTYPERLQAAGVSWRVYHEVDDFDDNALKYFAAYQQAQPGSPLYENAMRNRPADAFEEDVAADRLPQVSWIVAPTKLSEHPGVSAPALGAAYCNRILQAFARSPKVWAKTALLFTYDEDGGYFDHVRPPTPPPGTADEFIGGDPIGLGFRVPAVVCSPWTRGGYVCSQTYDHTSILRFLERRFGVEEPQISAWRRETCGDLWESFDFSAADASFPALPDTAAAAATATARCANGLPALPRVLNGPQPAQEPGTRPRRPCPGPAASVVVRLPRHAGRRVEGTLFVPGRRRRRLTARELRTGRVVVEGLEPARTVVLRLTLRVRRHGRLHTLQLTRHVIARCAKA